MEKDYLKGQRLKIDNGFSKLLIILVILCYTFIHNKHSDFKLVLNQREGNINEFDGELVWDVLGKENRS